MNRDWELSVVLAVMLVGLSFVFTATRASAGQRKLKVLIIDGRNNHEWQKTTPALKGMLEQTGRFTVDVHTAPAAEEQSTPAARRPP